MKSLKEQVSLIGLEKLTLSDFRKNPGQILQMVDLGKTFLLTKNSKSIAVLSPVPGVQLCIEIDSSGKVDYSL